MRGHQHHIKVFEAWITNYVPHHTLNACVETEIYVSFSRNFYHWLHRKLLKRQLTVQPVKKFSSKWHSPGTLPFSVYNQSPHFTCCDRILCCLTCLKSCILIGATSDVITAWTFSRIANVTLPSLKHTVIYTFIFVVCFLVVIVYLVPMVVCKICIYSNPSQLLLWHCDNRIPRCQWSTLCSRYIGVIFFE